MGQTCLTHHGRSHQLDFWLKKKALIPFLRVITLDMLTTVAAPEITLYQACWCASWSFHLHATHTHKKEKKISPMKGEDHKGRRCHGEFLFFHTDKDQFERLRLLVIRYKMVVEGLVCQKSIAEAIHFTLPTGSYSEDETAACMCAHTATRAHGVIKRFTPASTFCGICHCGALCRDIFILNVSPSPLHFFPLLSSTYLFSAVCGQPGAFGAQPLSPQMRLAAGISFTQITERARGRESFLCATFIGHAADLHSGV